MAQAPILDIDKLAEVSGEVSREFHDFLADVEDFVKEKSALTSEEIDGAKARFRKRLSQLQGSVNHLSEDLSQRVQQGAAVTNTYAHKQPWAIVLAAAALGAVLGVIMSRPK